MVSGVQLWQLYPSYNSRKVRFALGRKGVEYTAIEVGEHNKDAPVEVSGQPLTPVLRHNGTVIFDSGAIVRYIDANFPGPRLFSPSLDEMRAIENWETRAKATILPPYMQMAGQVRSGTMDQAVIAAGRQKFIAAAQEVEQSLNEHGVLVGSDLTAADIFCGCYLAYGFLTAAEAGNRPPLKWAMQNIGLAQQFPALARWYERLRALDRPE